MRAASGAERESRNKSGIAPKAATGDHRHGKQVAKQLTKKTWGAFESLFSAHGGVWGGCWCMYFHSPGTFRASAYEDNKKAKHELVEKAKAHGTIVFCGNDPVGWCQFGPKEELTRIDRKRGYVPTAADPWRITCLFISPGHRRSGFARLAVKESVRAMEGLGVRTIEAYPVDGGSSATLMWAGTPHLFEGAGFTRVRPLGKRSWIYALDVSRRN
jgi:acetyltransferase (GNAT) family protein